MSPKWWSRRPGFLLATKTNHQLSTNKAALGALRSPPQRNKTPGSNCTRKEGRTTALSQHCPTPQAGTAHYQEDSPQFERSPLTKKGRVGWATGLPNLSGHCMKGSLLSHPNQRLAKPRHTDMARNKEELELQNSATQWELPWFSVACSVEDPTAFAPEGSNGQGSHHGPPVDFTHLSPSLLPVSPGWPLQLHKCKVPA